MKRFITILLLVLCLMPLTGCSGELDPGALMQQMETIAAQIDVESIISEAIAGINQEELKRYALEGYETLTDKYPALKGDNIKAYLKDNGLELMRQYLKSTDADKQENARKLGEILKILNPELGDEVDKVLN